MPRESPTSVTAGASEIDVFDWIENAFDRATIFVDNLDATATITVRFYGRDQIGKGEAWLISGNDMEPATATVFTCVDLYGDFKVAVIRKAAADATPVKFKMLWEPTIKTGRTPRKTRLWKEAN